MLFYCVKKHFSVFRNRLRFLHSTSMQEWKWKCLSLGRVGLCDLMDCESARLLCPWDSPRQQYRSGLSTPFCKASSRPGYGTRVSGIASGFFYHLSLQGSPPSTQGYHQMFSHFSAISHFCQISLTLPMRSGSFSHENIVWDGDSESLSSLWALWPRRWSHTHLSHPLACISSQWWQNQ